MRAAVGRVGRRRRGGGVEGGKGGREYGGEGGMKVRRSKGGVSRGRDKGGGGDGVWSMRKFEMRALMGDAKAGNSTAQACILLLIWHACILLLY